MLALSLRGAERRSNLDLGAHCPTRLLRCARNDSHSIGFDQPDLVSDTGLLFWHSSRQPEFAATLPAYKPSATGSAKGG